jgi:hypothetical protein
MEIFRHGRRPFEQRVSADGREWSVHWEQGAWNTGGCDFPTIEIVSIHSTNDDTFEIVADVTDEIDGTKLSNQIHDALEVALQMEREA